MKQSGLKPHQIVKNPPAWRLGLLSCLQFPHLLPVRIQLNNIIHMAFKAGEYELFTAHKEDIHFGCIKVFFGDDIHFFFGMLFKIIFCLLTKSPG